MIGFLAQVDERKRVPIRRIAQKVGRNIYIELLRQIPGCVIQPLENGMSANASKPVLGIGEIRFSSMHNAMPVAAGGGMQLLTDRMRMVQVAMQ